MMYPVTTLSAFGSGYFFSPNSVVSTWVSQGNRKRPGARSRWRMDFSLFTYFCACMFVFHGNSGRGDEMFKDSKHMHLASPTAKAIFCTILLPIWYHICLSYKIRSQTHMPWLQRMSKQITHTFCKEACI